MLQRILPTIFWLLICSTCFAGTNYPILDSSASVSLLTCSPGEEIYSTFGHSALWINDPVNHLDKIYNYGTFSFGDDFLYKFIKGDLDYLLSLDRSDYFLEEYRMEQRSVTQQEFNLTQEEKQRLFEYLETNALPENANYRYDFLFDNCSTRIRDMLDSATNHRIIYDYSFAAPASYRTMVDNCAKDHPWLRFGMDLMTGLPMDKTSAPREHLFLPDLMMTAYFLAEINHNGKKEPMVKHSKVLVDIAPILPETPFWQMPAFVFGILCAGVMLISIFGYRKKKWIKGLDIILLIITSMIGALMIFFWTETRHLVAHQNMHLLWANPLYLIWIPFFFKGSRRFLMNSGLAYATLLFFMIINKFWFPQTYEWALIPILLMLMSRGIFIALYHRNIYPKIGTN